MDRISLSRRIERRKKIAAAAAAAQQARLFASLAAEEVVKREGEEERGERLTTGAEYTRAAEVELIRVPGKLATVVLDSRAEALPHFVLAGVPRHDRARGAEGREERDSRD